MHLCAHIFLRLQQKLSNETNWVNWGLASEVVGQMHSHLYVFLAHKEFPLDHVRTLGPFEGVTVREGARRSVLTDNRHLALT